MYIKITRDEVIIILTISINTNFSTIFLQRSHN